MIFGRRLDLTGADDLQEVARRVEEHMDYLQQMLELKNRALEERIRRLEAEA